MALADTLKTDMGKPPVTAKPAVVKPDISSDLDVNKLLEMSKVPYGKELGQIAEDKKAAEQRAAMGQAQIKEKLPSYIAERRGEMEGEIKPLQQQLEFKPDQEYFKNTANIFMLVGMLGSFIGGKGSASAASNAQAALTGMMQGLVKGDDAEYARQKSIFDENSKFINQKINDIKDIYKQSMEMAVKDGIYEGKTNLAQELSSIGADVPAALAQVKSLQDIQKVVEHLSKTQAATDTAQKQIDAAMARTKFSAGAASQRELQREAFEMGQQERTLRLKRKLLLARSWNPLRGRRLVFSRFLGRTQ